MGYFALADTASMNLNFLLHICDLYNKKNTELEKVFLFDRSNFINQSSEMWSTILTRLSVSTEINKTDFDFWVNNEIPFENLFVPNILETGHYKNIRKKFENWYFEEFQKVFQAFSSNLVIDYYRKITESATSEHLQLKDFMFYLQVVYQSPPAGWALRNEKMIIISPNSELPTVKEILNLVTK